MDNDYIHPHIRTMFLLFSLASRWYTFSSYVVILYKDARLVCSFIPLNIEHGSFRSIRKSKGEKGNIESHNHNMLCLFIARFSCSWNVIEWLFSLMVFEGKHVVHKELNVCVGWFLFFYSPHAQLIHPSFHSYASQLKYFASVNGASKQNWKVVFS